MFVRYFFLVLVMLVLVFDASARKKKKKAEPVIRPEQIVFSSLKFGATPAEYKLLYPDSLQKVGTHIYVFRPRFVNDKLVSLDIVTPAEEAKDFKQYGQVLTNAMVDYFTRAFGPPFAQWYVPALTSFTTYQRADISNWKINSKNIEIYIVKSDYRSFRGVCSITNKALTSPQP